MTLPLLFEPNLGQWDIGSHATNSWDIGAFQERVNPPEQTILGAGSVVAAVLLGSPAVSRDASWLTNADAGPATMMAFGAPTISHVVQPASYVNAAAVFGTPSVAIDVDEAGNPGSAFFIGIAHAYADVATARARAADVAIPGVLSQARGARVVAALTKSGRSAAEVN